MASILLTIHFSPDKVRIEEKLVKDVQERVIVRTVIKERPDGTKETIIDERRDTDTHIERERVTTAMADTAISLSQSLSGEFRGDTVYTLGIQKKLLGSLSGGIYARTDKEYGVTLSYSF